MLNKEDMKQLNQEIAEYFGGVVFPLEETDKLFREGVNQLVMLDRYAYKDTELKTIKVGDVVLLTVKEDPQFPARGIGKIVSINGDNVEIKLDGTYATVAGSDVVTRKLSEIEKPMELSYEQISRRVANGLSSVEQQYDPSKQQKVNEAFYNVLSTQKVVPAGRVLYGAGANTQVTYFNCYVLPFIHDSRGGIAKHREEAMEIMSRGGGVGTNGSTLRPKHALAKGVNGKSSGAVSWLNDLANLTNLIEQGGSRRGAQMIMLSVWHPDILEFIISKMQNPEILKLIIETTQDEEIKYLAQTKLKFTPLTPTETAMYEEIVSNSKSQELISEAKKMLEQGGRYGVNNPEFLEGANISVNITDEFMDAVKHDADFALQFPDIDNYTPSQKQVYDEEWSEVGDVRKWALPLKTHRTIKAQQLWELINICATYSAEPGIFFIDRANQDTNATSYGQKVIATNPCGKPAQ